MLNRSVIPFYNQFQPQQLTQPVPQPVPQSDDISPKLVNDIYFEHPTGYFFRDSKNRYNRFTDFIIVKITKVVSIGRSDLKTEFFNLNLRCESGYEEEVTIPFDKFSNLPKDIEKKYHQFLIFVDRYSRANEFFKRVSKEILRRELNAGRVQVNYVYSRWGWGLPDANGARQFFSDSASENNSPKKLSKKFPTFNQHQNYIKQGFDLFFLRPTETMLPLLLYALASYADALFSDAGYPLAHSLMLMGKSGYGKTSVARAVFAPFDPESKRIHTVEGTEAAMKLLVRDSRDDVLVIDDFNLEGTRQELNRKLRNLRMLIRIQADKSAPEKFAGNNTVERIDSRGGTVFTGEVAMLGQIVSSELRYLKLFFNQPISNETLSTLQSSNEPWCILLSEWIRFLATDYVGFVNFIRIKFPEMRQTSKISEPRLRDAFIHHSITAQIFMNFIRSYQLIDDIHAAQFLNQFSTIMSTLVENQGNDAKQRAIHLMFISELRNLRGNGNISIAPTLDDYLLHIREYVGYEDSKGHIFLKKDDIFRIISDSYRNRGEFFPTSANDLPKVLYENNLTKANAGSYTVKASSLIEGRPPMICLVKDAYEKILAELDD